MSQPSFSQYPSAPPSAPEASAPPLTEARMDKAAMFAQQHQQEQMQGGVYNPIYPTPPPPYSEQPPPQPYPQPPPPVGPMQQHPPPVGPMQQHPPPTAYLPPQPPVATTSVVMMPTPQPAPAAPSVVVVGAQAALAPGVCTVCRKGKIKSSRTCWTYCCCLLFCLLGILPGIIVFCCCCQKPKCTHCGYSP